MPKKIKIRKKVKISKLHKMAENICGYPLWAKFYFFRCQKKSKNQKFQNFTEWFRITVATHFEQNLIFFICHKNKNKKKSKKFYNCTKWLKTHVVTYFERNFIFLDDKKNKKKTKNEKWKISQNGLEKFWTSTLSKI